MPWDYTNPRAIRPGDVARLELPWSAVCMHMRVAGRVMHAQMTHGKYPMVQLLNPSGSNFSAPILTSEAGVYGDVEHGFYYYAVKDDAPSAGSNPADGIDLDAELTEPEDDLFDDEALG